MVWMAPSECRQRLFVILYDLMVSMSSVGRSQIYSGLPTLVAMSVGGYVEWDFEHHGSCYR